MADWDADDFDPDADGKLSAPKLTDKWDGEDEEDDIKVRLKIAEIMSVSLANCNFSALKDAWDAESEEEKDDDSQKDENKVVKVKKKKNLAQKIAEKEEAAAKARLEKLAREEEEKQLNTPEGNLSLFVTLTLLSKMTIFPNIYNFRETGREVETAKDARGK